MGLSTAGKAMLAIRSSFGLTFAPAWTSLPAKSGLPDGQLTPAARFFSAAFGVREFLMVAMVARAATSDDDTVLRDALRASAAIDALDLGAALTLAAVSPACRKPAVMSAVGAAASGSCAALAAVHASR